MWKRLSSKLKSIELKSSSGERSPPPPSSPKPRHKSSSVHFESPKSTPVSRRASVQSESDPTKPLSKRKSSLSLFKSRSSVRRSPSASTSAESASLPVYKDNPFDATDIDEEKVEDAELERLMLASADSDKARADAPEVEAGIIAAQDRMDAIKWQLDCLCTLSAQNCTITNEARYLKEKERQDQINADIRRELAALAGYLKRAQDNLVAVVYSPTIRRMLLLQIDTIQKFIFEVTNELTDVVAANEERRMKHLKYQVKINNPELELPENAPSEGLQHQVFKHSLTSQHLHELIEREEQIKSLHKSLLELKEMFLMLSQALALQEESITAIEQSVTQATVRVSEANIELKKALKYNNRSRKQMALIVALLTAGAVTAAGITAAKAGALAM